MTIQYDTFLDWQMKNAPNEIMLSIVDYLTNNPEHIVGITLPTGETESILMLIGKEVIRASVTVDGFAPMGVVYTTA